MIRSDGFRWPLLPILCLAIAACAPQKTVKKTPGASKTAGEAGAEGAEAAPGVEVAEASIRNGSEFAPLQSLKPVNFEYDAYLLDDGARAVLKANADYLRSNAEMEMLVAGNCDERGTIEYNLALGQRRAKAVREYYIRLGIPGKSVATISYGEEKPACAQSTEECWAKNRRADTLIRARTVSAPGDAPKSDGQ